MLLEMLIYSNLETQQYAGTARKASRFRYPTIPRRRSDYENGSPTLRKQGERIAPDAYPCTERRLYLNFTFDWQSFTINFRDSGLCGEFSIMASEEGNLKVMDERLPRGTWQIVGHFSNLEKESL